MKQRLLFFAAFVIVATTLANGQAKLVEKITNMATKLSSPMKNMYCKRTTLIIHEDHSDPLVHVDVTYHVGSAREQIGKSGFAHFFEHMMFEGSDHALKGTHDKIISGNGGTLNGSTNRDRTNYTKRYPATSWKEHYGWNPIVWVSYWARSHKQGLKCSVLL
jgi:zinc protease